ncbi:MAG: YegS/Rv2252/BmrU family lipid kinase [Spirochaetes bacterium]|nr:YegS/Rv2252/BmrU family lipid kinase [Spirochaetota bacterium]
MSAKKYHNPIIFYHAKARAGRSNELFNHFQEKIDELQLFTSYQLFDSQSHEETNKKIKEVHENSDHDLIISYGGDGTLSSICNAMMHIDKKKRLPLLPVPGGSGNSFIKDFNIHCMEDAFDHYQKGLTSSLDVLQVEELHSSRIQYCINILGMGFISDIARNVEKNIKRLGSFSYVLGTILSLSQFKKYKAKIIYNQGNETFQSDNVYFLTVSNSKYSGGNILLAPHAKIDDGLLDITILHDLNRFQFLRGFSKTFKGKHIEETRICKYIQATDVEIIAEPSFHLMPDGDLIGHSPVKIKIMPGEIQLAI